MKIYNLFDISNPKQWKTISSEDFDANGKYPVYGANGIIGKTNTFNHEEETVLITCRGATCGTVNLSEPFSYINGNAMALDDLDKSKATTKYVYYFFQSYNFQNVITGSAQPQITREGLRKVQIPLPDLETQNKIAAILDKAKSILDKREETIRKYDELLRATFLEMFGDVPNNPKRFSKETISGFGTVITGNTPPRGDKRNYETNFIEWIKTDNILSNSHILTNASEYLSEIGFSKSRYVDQNALLVTCIAGSIGSIGRCAITDRRVAFNQQINAIIPNGDISVYFLYWMFKVSAEYIQSFTTGGMKRLLTKGEFEKILLLNPPYELQLQFEQIAIKYAFFKSKLQKYKNTSQNLLESLSQKVFSDRITIDIDVELESLIDEIDLNELNYIGKRKYIKVYRNITEDITFLQRLLNRVEDQDIRDQNQYEKAKSIIYRALKKGRKIEQIFDPKLNKLMISIIKFRTEN